MVPTLSSSECIMAWLKLFEVIVHVQIAGFKAVFTHLVLHLLVAHLSKHRVFEPSVLVYL